MLEPTRLFFATAPTRTHARERKGKKAERPVCNSCVNTHPRNNAYPERFSDCRECCNRYREFSTFSTSRCMPRRCFEYAHNHNDHYHHHCRLGPAGTRPPPARHSRRFTMSIRGSRTRCCFPISALNRRRESLYRVDSDGTAHNHHTRERGTIITKDFYTASTFAWYSRFDRFSIIKQRFFHQTRKSERLFIRSAGIFQN
jgi:hypothetical protein